MAVIRFPTVCPACQKESVTERSQSLVDEVLQGCVALSLYAACHNIWWQASVGELEQLAQYRWASDL
jgi:hypothetical protein